MDTRRYRSTLALTAALLAACAHPPDPQAEFVKEVRSVCRVVEGHRVEPTENPECVVCQAEGHAVAACTVK